MSQGVKLRRKLDTTIITAAVLICMDICWIISSFILCLLHVSVKQTKASQTGMNTFFQF